MENKKVPDTRPAFGVVFLYLLGGFGTPPVNQVGEPVTEETLLEVGTQIVA